MVELVADAANVAHDGHQEVHTCETAATMHLSPRPARWPALSRGPFASPPSRWEERRGEREKPPGQDAVAGTPRGWVQGPQLLQVRSGLGSYHMRCWGCRSLSLSTPLWIYLWTSPGNTQVWASVRAAPELLQNAGGAWFLPMLFDTALSIPRRMISRRLCVAFSEPLHMLIPPECPSQSILFEFSSISPLLQEALLLPQ